MNFDKHISEDILFKKDIDWNISGAFVHDDITLTFVRFLRDYFGIQKPISSVHGSPPVLWNSGRRPAPQTKKDINAIIDIYKENDINFYLTFSNHLIKKKDLNNKECNYLLDKIAENKNNGVIIASDELSKYIKDKYPYLKQIVSVLKSDIYTGEHNKEFYDDLSERFDRVVINPNDTLNFTLLNSLKNKDKIEIMLNDNCTYGCEFRTQHRNMQSALIKNENVFLKNTKDNFLNKNCFFQKLNNLHYGKANHARKRSLHLNVKEMNHIYDMGFRYFKLQGRADKSSSFLSYLCRYILKPEYSTFIFKNICSTNTFKKTNREYIKK